MRVDLGAPPHCDQAVLHAPAECAYCDRHPDWQALRTLWGVAFTGHPAAEGQLPCPSDSRRGTGGAHGWMGNQPRPAAERLATELDWRPTRPSWMTRVLHGWFGDR